MADLFAVLGVGPADVFEGFSDAFEWLNAAVERLDVVEWALLALGLLLLWRAGVLFWTGKRLGPITIADLTSPPADVDGKRLAALMRESLASVGATPEVELPAGRPAIDLEAVVKSSPIPQAAWVAAVVTFLQALLRRFTGFGFRAEGTLQAGTVAGHTCGITVALSKSASGKLLKMSTFWAPTFEEAVERAAFWLYIEVVDAEKSRNLLAPWQHWTDPDALRLYHEGIELEADNPAKALEAYRQSARRDERNVLPWMAIANACERLAATAVRADNSRHWAEARTPLLEALACYQEVAHFRPELVEARYRLANLCSFSETWERAWRNRPARDPQFKRLQSLIGQIDPPNANDIVKALLQRSLAEYERLIESVVEDPAYDPMIRVARLCTQIQVTSGAYVAHATEVEAILDAGDANWETYYNSACFYTLAIQYADHAKKGTYADRALELLDEVLRDPQSSLPPGWVTREDPDLQPLRDWLAGQPLTPPETPNRRRTAWAAVFTAAIPRTQPRGHRRRQVATKTT